MAVDLLSIFRIKTDVIDRLPIPSSTSNQSILSSEFQSFNNEHHFIPLGFRNRMHQWRKIGFQRKYARNFCWLFINVTSWSCNHKNHHQTKLHQNIWTICRRVLLKFSNKEIKKILNCYCFFTLQPEYFYQFAF